jgi:hypothetical protein
MAKIIMFPKSAKAPDPVAQEVHRPLAKAVPAGKGNGFFAGLVMVVWVVVVLAWPMLQWIVSMDVLFQLIRMMYHWNTPGGHVGWTFLLHFGLLFILTCFVSLYQPKGF